MPDSKAAHRRYRAARKQRLIDNPDIVQHGVMNTYQTYQCRCDQCCAAAAAYAASPEMKARRLARHAAFRDHPEMYTHVAHGKPSTYTYWGCRCPLCTKANSAVCAANQQRRKAAS